MWGEGKQHVTVWSWNVVTHQMYLTYWTSRSRIYETSLDQGTETDSDCSLQSVSQYHVTIKMTNDDSRCSAWLNWLIGEVFAHSAVLAVSSQTCERGERKYSLSIFLHFFHI